MWRVRISPCPNDTFIFYHLITSHAKEFEFVFEDIQTLNEKCLKLDGDIIKISFAVYPKVQNEYLILDSGAALGEGCGPLLIGKKDLKVAEIDSLPVALPGKYTTANRLFELFYPNAKNKIYTTYEKIMPMVKAGDVAAGVIIHESRFTYAQHDLVLVSDLGRLFEEKYKMPLPLGGIVGKRELGKSTLQEIALKIQKSIHWANQNRLDKNFRQFIKNHAREIDDSVIENHINLYVNQYSVTLGEKGKAAINSLLGKQIESEPKIFIN